MKRNSFNFNSLSAKNELELTTVNSKTPFAIKEAYKSLYTNILYLNIEDKCKKIAITSAFSGEGKSTVAANLAITYSTNSENKNVLLIDVDMHLPKISKLLSIDRKQHGLSEYLAGIDKEPNFVFLPEYKLTVLTSGATSANPTKLISSSKMAELVKLCEEKFDCIIFDTPPVTVVTDAIHLKNYVNGYIISTKADYSNINGVNKCLEALNCVGAEVFGFVLSSLKLKKQSKSRYGKYVRNYGGGSSTLEDEGK